MQPKDALLIVDMQSDLLPCGALARLPDALRLLDEFCEYRIKISDALHKLAEKVNQNSGQP